MPTRLESVVVDAADPSALGRFWADALGWTVTADEPDEVAVEVEAALRWGDGGPPALVFVPTSSTNPALAIPAIHRDVCGGPAGYGGGRPG